MRPATGSPYVTQFETPKQSLSGLSAEANAALLSASADVVLVIDSEGLVQDVSSSHGALPVAGGQHSWMFILVPAASGFRMFELSPTD